MVRSESADLLGRAYALHPHFPSVQRTTSFWWSTRDQLRLCLHAPCRCSGPIKRIRVHTLHDGCLLSRAQSTITTSPRGRCYCEYRGWFLSYGGSFNRGLCKLCGEGCDLRMQSIQKVNTDNPILIPKYKLYMSPYNYSTVILQYIEPFVLWEKTTTGCSWKTRG